MIFKNAVFIFAIFVSTICLATVGHEHHAKHNMILFGESEIFASHIVYKVPHNFQVLLKLKLSAEIKQTYLNEKSLHQQDQFILLLDTMDISKIKEADQISGQILRENPSGKQDPIGEIELTREKFQVIYFDELPLNLGGD